MPMSIAQIGDLQQKLAAAAEINAFLKRGHNKHASFQVEPADDPDVRRQYAKASVAMVALTDAERYRTGYDEDEDLPDEFLQIYVPVNILDRALREELSRLKDELRAAGITCEEQ